MLQRIFDMLSFGCHHRRISKPFSAARTQASANSEWRSLQTKSGEAHYVVCLECGRKFGYDWSRMKMIR